MIAVISLRTNHYFDGFHMAGELRQMIMGGIHQHVSGATAHKSDKQMQNCDMDRHGNSFGMIVVLL